MKKIAEKLVQANELRDQKYSSSTHDQFVSNLRTASEIYMELLAVCDEKADVFRAIAAANYALALFNPDEDYQRYYAAIDYIKRALHLQPNNGHFHAILGEYYHLGINDYKKAAEEYRIALEFTPCDIQALNSAAILYGLPDSPIQLEEAIGYLERLVNLEPDEPIYHANYFELLKRAGRLQDAKNEGFKALLCPRALQRGWIEEIKAILTEQ
jgi:tetratricopeptide (TPR) repeat protein